MMTTIRVVAAVIREGDRFLICQRPTHKRHGGLWEFPGGKVEENETDLEAARRELREELDVEVTHIGRELLSRHDDGSPFVIVFVETVISGTPSCREHLALQWSTLSELTLLQLAPSDKAFVASLIR
jgi:mutator protein MutT